MKHTLMVLKLIVLLTFVGCTKSRKAELPEDVQADILAIAEFSGAYQADRDSSDPSTVPQSLRAFEQNQSARLSADEVNVPNRLKFMFENLSVSAQTAKKFEIKFLVDTRFVTAFKVVASAKELTAIEKSLAMTADEVSLIEKSLRASKAELKTLSQSLIKASNEKNLIKMSKKDGTLLVPILKYAIAGYGVIQRVKNELKEETAVLKLTATEFKNATHIQIKSLSDGRVAIGKSKDFEQLFVENKIDNQVMTAAELQTNLNIGLRFLDDSARVYTRLDADVMHVYQIMKVSELTDTQARLLKNKAGNEEVISCSDESVKSYVQSKDADCVLVLKADVPIAYTTVELAKANDDGSASGDFEMKTVPRSQSVGLVEIQKNSAAVQKDITGALDPDSTVRLADLKGEFFYRRTFEAASNMFLGRTGTSGDMLIVQFELEDKRLVVRNQQSLITYTGQGPRDREEIMSFPVKYVRMNKISATGAALTIPVAETTTKEKAEYAIIDWTQNTVPNASSPLAFYADGSCFKENSSQRVTDTDMRLSSDGILNFSLSGSYTMQDRTDCIAMSDTNSAYWKGMYQFNYNIVERISFKKHTQKSSDIQFAPNISSMAQEAFNFGVFTLADKLTESGKLANRDGSEKYMPLVHDFRDNKKVTYYLGGLNTEATSPERRQLLIEATKQVVDEWNATLRYAFRGTSLKRDSDYIELIIDDGSKKAVGHLGDLDRNYIWLQELPAENGLLGVAQPAANPRSGTVESANVIVYTGNTYDQTKRLLAATTVGRAYEKELEKQRQKFIQQSQEQNKLVISKDEVAAAAETAAVGAGKINTEGVNKIKTARKNLTFNLKSALQALKSDATAAKAHQTIKKLPAQQGKKITKQSYKDNSKGEKVSYEVNQKTFLKKIAELSMNKSLIENRHEFELAVNNAFLQFAGIDETSKAILQKRSEQLAMAVRFDKNNKHRPGCFKYSRNDANDEALVMDKDPQKNLMLNFKKNVMTTLSHELGHAFGLLHNFTASTDSKNFEFPGAKETGRNYSSIMDYIADIDQTYAGPGPYDAHALRAAYTGQVEMADGKMAHIFSVMKQSGLNSLVHLTKDTLNKNGILKHYAQCSDGSLSTNAMCAQFDVGGSAVEIVKNKIADYNRGYISRNYVHDKIIFGWTQKLETINRNISLFQSIRGYLDAAFMSEFNGTGRPAAAAQAIIQDQVQAAQLGYNFFHELIRTPDARGVSAGDIKNRLVVVPYHYVARNSTKEDGAECKANPDGSFACKGYKVLEARSIYDRAVDRDKLDTFGIGYDKFFALQFLMQSSAPRSMDDSNNSTISYLDFEQYFLQISDPANSLTINTMLQIMTDTLNVGFFAPNASLVETKQPTAVNQLLADQTAVASIISLAESKWRGFDPFAEAFKVNTAPVRLAPEDRPNVAKQGQSRDKSDTRVMFASQSGVGSTVMVHEAARIETLFANRDELYQLMSDIFVADMVYQEALNNHITKAREKVCAVDKENKPVDQKACETESQKSMLAYIAEIPEVAAQRAAADVVAAKIVSKMRALNIKELFMPAASDAADSPANFVNQVEWLREMLVSQINIVQLALGTLKASEKSKLTATIQSIVGQLQQISVENRKLESLHLLALGQSFITVATADFEVEIQSDNDGDKQLDKISGAQLAQILMNGRKLETTQTRLLQVLGSLSTYSRSVDPDSTAN